jgi:ABC-type branched-subunit amino acid transport system substrate-binding protein
MLEQGLNVLLVGFGSILVSDASHIAGHSYSKLPGVYLLQNLDESKATTREFFAAYHEEFGDEELSGHLAKIYDGIVVLAEALKPNGGEGGQKHADALDLMEPYELDGAV